MKSGNSTTLVEPSIILFLYYARFLLVEVMWHIGRVRPYLRRIILCLITCIRGENIFAALRILGRALRNYRNAHVRDLCYGHPPKHHTSVTFMAWVIDIEKMPFFKITHFSFIRDLSHGRVFWSIRRARE
jgi:hypothetical protein